MKIFLLLVGLFIFSGSKELDIKNDVLHNHPVVLEIKEFIVDYPTKSDNIFTSNDFSISKTNFNKNTYYIFTSRRNDDENIFQTLFIDSKSFEKTLNLKNEEEISVCVYYYKKEFGYRDNINLTSEEIKNEVTYIDEVRNQKYYYDYCGTNMFIKKTNEGSLLLLINNTLQTPKNWYELNTGLIEIKNENLDNLNSLISKK